MIFLSKIFCVKDFIAFIENLISFSSQIKFFSNIAHIEQFFAVFLKQEWADIKISCWNSNNDWPPYHLFGNENSPAEQYISYKNWITQSFEYYIIVILSRSYLECDTFCRYMPSLFILEFCRDVHRNWRWTFWGSFVEGDWLQVMDLTILVGIRNLIFPWYIVELWLTFSTLVDIKLLMMDIITFYLNH